jgi:hypothetical protein
VGTITPFDDQSSYSEIPISWRLNICSVRRPWMNLAMHLIVSSRK